MYIIVLISSYLITDNAEYIYFNNITFLIGNIAALEI